MPKTKKGRHHHYSASKKHYSGTHQCHRSPLRDVSNSTSVNSIIPLETLALAHPPGWQISNNADTLEMSLLANHSTSAITFSVKIRKNLRWEVRVHDNALPVGSKIYDELPTLVTSTEFFNVICSTIQSLNVCEGNSDDFLSR